MIRISDSERKAILARYPDAWITATKHHSMLSGYADSRAMVYLRSLRGEDKKQRPRPARMDGNQPQNRHPRRG